MIPISRPVTGDQELEAIRRPIASGWLTQGPEVDAFEREFRDYVGAPYASAVSSATAALHLALRAVGVQAGDEVITVSHSFIATANCIRYCGATPVFVDIEPDSYNMDPARLEEAITPRTRAILCVHQMGMPCDLRAILGIAARHSLKVVEDAACAIGSEIEWQGRWERIGKPHADVACFSFHPRKLVTTGDGGMLTTASAELDRRFKAWRQHGMSVPDTVRHGASVVIFESYPELGYNYRLTDVQAAIGREQLKRLPDMLARRRALAARYGAALRSIPGITPPDEPSWARTNWQSYCARLDDALDQKRVMQDLLDQGIATRRGVMCAHREAERVDGVWTCGAGRQCAEGCAPRGCRRLAESERAQDRSILLPLFPQLTEEDHEHVIRSLSLALERRLGAPAVGAAK